MSACRAAAVSLALAEGPLGPGALNRMSCKQGTGCGAGSGLLLRQGTVFRGLCYTPSAGSPRSPAEQAGVLGWLTLGSCGMDSSTCSQVSKASGSWQCTAAGPALRPCCGAQPEPGYPPFPPSCFIHSGSGSCCLCLAWPANPRSLLVREESSLGAGTAQGPGSACAGGG